MQLFGVFSKLYMNKGVDRPHIPNLFEDRLSFDMRKALEVPFQMEEVRETMFSMKKDKALGPDDYSMHFFSSNLGHHQKGPNEGIF